MRRGSGDTCTVPGCGCPVVARGWCSKHYTRWWRGYGMNGKQRVPLSEPVTFRMTKADMEALREYARERNKEMPDLMRAIVRGALKQRREKQHVAGA